MDTEYCNKCGLLHDPDDGECLGCKMSAELKEFKEKVSKYESEGCLMCQAFIEGSEEWEYRTREAEGKLKTAIDALENLPCLGHCNANGDSVMSLCFKCKTLAEIRGEQ